MRKSQRFLVSLWTEERTPADIARAIVEAGLIDPEVETVHVLVYEDSALVRPNYKDTIRQLKTFQRQR